MKQSFQAGVDTIYNKIVSCGQTPSDKSPTSISNAIQDIYNNRYNEGYNNGRTQGQNDVKNNPNGYGLYTQQQYDQNYTNGYNAGKEDNPISKGALIARFKGNQYHNWNDTSISQNGSVGFDCSRIQITCAGFTNHNALLLVYNSSGTTLTTISLNNNGTYEWNGSGIRSWNISYNFPQGGAANINYSYAINIYY